MNEFDIIKTFFKNPQPFRPSNVVLGIGDDCAIVDIPPDHHLAITTDTLIEGVHFSKNTQAFDIGYKSLAVNLSDLAAMGATPAWFTLALSLPTADESWLAEFAQGLFTLSQEYQIALIGGDLTKSEKLTITIGAHGLLKKNQALTRSRAQVGDLICVSNSLGDAALGLLVVQHKLSISEPQKEFFLNKLHRPQPRVALGKKLLHIATAAIDISDGLAADLAHILKASGVGAKINVDALPFSQAMQESVAADDRIALALNGGDDYELCFTIPPSHFNLLPAECASIGTITQKMGLVFERDDGRIYLNKTKGYQHF